MSRTEFYDVVLNAAGTGVVVGALIDVRTVAADNTQGASGSATIYGSETGIATANPFTTGADGWYSFWAGINARYDIVISAAGLTTRTLRVEASWFPPPPASVGVGQLALDVLPIGTKIAWWRPNSGIPIPTGWVELAGQTLSSVEHDFPGGGSIVVPDMRNLYEIGANSANTDGQAGVEAAGAGNAPGVGGGVGEHQHILQVSESPQPQIESEDHGGGVLDSIAGSVAIYDTTGGGGTGHGLVTTTIGAFAIGLFAQGGGGAHNNMPQSVGWIQLMKVKNE